MDDAKESVRAGTEELQVGRRLKHAIYDTNGALLLAAGSMVTGDVKLQLLRRGIREVAVHPEDAPPGASAPLAERVSISLSSEAELAAQVARLNSAIRLVVENQGPPVRDAITSPGLRTYDEQRQQQLIHRFDGAASVIQEMVGQLLEGTEQDATQLSAIADQYTEEMTADTDQVIAISEQHGYSGDLARRSVRLATLSMAAGIHHGFDVENLRDLGTCAIVHDWGMYCLSERLLDPLEPFSDADWHYFMKHPGYTLDALEQMDGLSDAVRLAAYQVHEQMDGSGYPGGISGDRIHPFAKIINVVDEYLFLTSDVRGRPAIYPYDAMVYLLTQTSLGRFDPDATRAVVELLSVFPIGSHVQLSDGSPAVVLRQNGGEHTRPIVQRLSEETGQPMEDGGLVDLTRSDVTISGPLPTPNRHEMRLERDMMAEIIWQGPE